MLTRVLEANMSLLLVMLVLQVMLGSIVNHVCLKKPFLFEKKSTCTGKHSRMLYNSCTSKWTIVHNKLLRISSVYQYACLTPSKLTKGGFKLQRRSTVIKLGNKE